MFMNRATIIQSDGGRFELGPPSLTVALRRERWLLRLRVDIISIKSIVNRRAARAIRKRESVLIAGDVVLESSVDRELELSLDVTLELSSELELEPLEVGPNY